MNCYSELVGFICHDCRARSARALGSTCFLQMLMQGQQFAFCMFYSFSS